MPRRKKIPIFLILCSGLPLLVGCPKPIYMPVEPAYNAHGTLRTDGHYVRDDYLRKLDADLKACTKP